MQAIDLPNYEGQFKYTSKLAWDESSSPPRTALSNMLHLVCSVFVDND